MHRKVLLATAVIKAGGIGIIGSILDMEDLEATFERARSSFASHPVLSSRSTLPLGLGLLLSLSKLDQVMSVLAKYRPANLWFFAAKEVEDWNVGAGCPTAKLSKG